MVQEGPLNIVGASQMQEYVQSYYQIHKEEIIKKNLKYYYEHQQEIR
jgi:hypothetical protein